MVCLVVGKSSSDDGPSAKNVFKLICDVARHPAACDAGVGGVSQPLGRSSGLEVCSGDDEKGDVHFLSLVGR